jgi:hypothetical protein
MHLLKSCLLPFAALVAGVLTLSAQTPAKARVASTGGHSPHETFSVVLAGGNRVMIVYGRPFSRDPKTGEIRQIWGGLVGGPANPWGRPWRMGSDEATLLVTTAPLQFGDVNVPAGAYSLYMLPVENGPSQLIINRRVGQWGINRQGIAYPPDMQATEVGRVDLKKDDLPQQVDELTIQIAKTSDGGVFKLQWEKTQFSVPFTLAK